MSTAVFAQLQDGLEVCRRTLWQASWSPSWDAAEPKIQVARDELACALGVLALEDMPDNYDDALPHLAALQVLWTGAHEALQLVLRSIDTAIQFQSAGEQPTLVCRRLVSEAIKTLDDALDTARGL